MFEGIVAHLLNKYLGKYIDDLDCEQLNVGIFSGTVHLTDLHLKPEALAELDLPVEVKQGCIAKISIDIPWTALYYEPVLIHIEEILILAGPVADRRFDPERDKRLNRARKRKRLEDAEYVREEDLVGEKPKGFLESLATTIMNNIQISIQNVHIRYEDTVSNDKRHPLTCGLVLQNVTAITTNNKWKAAQIDSDAKSIFKLVKVESLSLYWNPSVPTNTLVRAQLHTNGWKTLLRKGLATFSINGEDFDFILKPVSFKIKMILNKSKEAKVPKLLLDFVLQDAASQLSRDQFLSMYMWSRTIKSMEVNLRYRKYFNGNPVKGHASEWWHNAYDAVLGEYIQPYTWAKIKEHRNKYRKYKSLYKEYVHKPHDTELRLDLQLQEDTLDVANILLAREQARIELAKEEPHMVKKITKRKPSPNWFDDGSDDTDFGVDSAPELYEETLVAVGEKEKSWWTRMTSEERERLFEGIGYEENLPETDVPLHYIAHKLNFTLANCTLSLFNSSREILVVTVTHFLSSFETRPGAKAFKLSARTESFVVEGASIENDLVPILTADSITSGSDIPHVFALDLEKSPLQVEAHYGLSISAEPMEVIYHKHAVNELLSFFDLPKVAVDHFKRVATEKLYEFSSTSKTKIVAALNKRKTVHLNIDLKAPYFVIPEHGSLQQSGSILVIDTGRLTVNSDLQADPSLQEDATKMEVEERLYDRFTIALFDAQVLFSDSGKQGDEWRVAKQTPESDMHLVPKTRVTVVFSNSIKSDCKTLPRQKLNISVPALKLILSDRRVSMLAEFFQRLPVPKASSSRVPTPVESALKASHSDKDLCKHSIFEPSVKELKAMRKLLHCRKVKNSLGTLTASTESSAKGTLERHQSASSEPSDDEECEHWARIVDLPGFEDNVSASNSILILLRFTVGEIALHLARSSDHVDRPYLMFRADKLCVDAAVMEYGPALQASLHTIQLVDKLHPNSTGEYLELISSTEKTDMITVLYRKVRADCPEFKSHFHQVEHSLVLDLTSLSVAFHREAFLTLDKFLQYVWAKLKPRSGVSSHPPLVNFDSLPKPGSLVLHESGDPPVPPGATKFSISARMNALNVRLCDTDIDLADLKIAGLECDYVLKANEKSVLRLDLSELSLEDLMEETLYSKIISTEEEKIFDIKIVKNSPHHKEIEVKDDQSLPMKVDGSMRIHFGRVIVVLVQSFVNELQRFIEPFFNDTAALFKKSAESKIQRQVSEFQNSDRKYQLSIDIHAPTFLLPQKPTSPNSLVLSLGDLGVENFFHEVPATSSSHIHYIDNILVRLNAFQISRAVILLDGKMEIREPILEPLKLRLDVKRSLAPHHRDILLYEVSGSMDNIKVNIGQRDLSTMIIIYQENYSQMKFLNSTKSASSPISPLNSETPSEESMRKLEVFLYTATDIYKETSFTFIMEGMNITLYNDGEDINSALVRDPLQALSTFELDEVKVSVEMSSDKTMELKCSCQAATVIDSTVSSSSPLRKIFQSYSGDSQAITGVLGISLSMPPMIDLTYRQTGNGDASVDVVVEKIRLNVSVLYLLSLLKFVSDALPGTQHEGYLCKDQLMDHKVRGETTSVRRRLPSDTTSGYHSTTSAPPEDNVRALSISAVLRKPEIVLFAGPASMDSEVVVIKLDVMFDYCFNLGQGNFVLSVAGLHILSCVYGRRKQTMFMVLHPCEAEFSKTQKLADSEVKMLANVSSINICLSAPVVHTISNIILELIKTTQNENLKKNYKFDHDQKQNIDLWSAVSVTPQKWIESANGSYITGPFILPKFSESFAFSAPEIQLFCEVSGPTKRIPVLCAKAAIETEIKDWSSHLNIKGEAKLEAMYYNQQISSWEPLLEQIMVAEGHYRPLEIMWKIFKDRSHPIMCHNNDKDWSCDLVDHCDGLPASADHTSSSSSGDDTEGEDSASMTVIKKNRLTRMKRISSIVKSRDSSSLLAYPVDSDSENEGDDGMLGKIASAFDHLFSSDGESDSEDDEDLSDSEGVADLDAGGSKSDSGETETADASATDDDRPPVFFSLPPSASQKLGSGDASVILDGNYSYETAIYVALDCRDSINLNVTPSAVSVLNKVMEDFTSETMERANFSCRSDKSLTLRNLLGPETSTKFLKKHDNEAYEVIEEACGLSLMMSQTKNDVFAPLVDISPPDSDSEMAGDETDCFNISSALVSAKKKDYVRCNMMKEKTISELYEEVTKEKLSIEVDGFDKLVCLVPKRTTTAMYALQPVKNKTRYFVMVGTDLCYEHRTVTVYSPLKVENHLSKAIHILCQKSVLEALGTVPEHYSKNPFQDKFIRLTTLDAGQTYSVPLYVAYHCKLFIQPVTSAVNEHEYKISSEGILWQDVIASQKNGKFYSCLNTKDDQSRFCVKVMCIENKEVKTPSVGTKLIPNYTLHLYPPIVIHNILPFAIALHFKKNDQVYKLSEGEQLKIFDIEPHETQEITFEVIQYLGIQWHGKLPLSANQEEHKPVLMNPETDTCGGNRHLSVHVHTSSFDAYLFSPYWIINKTGLPLQFRGSSSDNIYEVAATTDPLLFRFKKHRRKKAKLRVYSSHWSRSFSLDTVGNCGVVICTDHERNKKYRFFVSIEMSKLLLTKIVTIKPYYLVMNNTQSHLRFMEKNDNTDLWFDIAPEKCLSFWPETDSLKMFVKQRDSKVVSQNFPFSKPHVTVLRMEHGSALRVEVKCGEDTPTFITFQPYVPGDAPVRVENFCEDLFLKLHQKCLGQCTLLNPYHSILYTWDDPAQERTLIWNLYNRKKPGFPARIYKDGYGHEKVSFHSLRGKLQAGGSLKSSLEESSSDDDDSESEDGVLLPKKTRKDKVVVYWVSYIEKNQRVLLFTQDDRIAREARKAVDGEKANLECFLSVNSVGLSLMNGVHRELAYLSLNACPAIWEIEINNTWKLLTLELSAWLEDKWRHDHQKPHLKDYLQVDLAKMHMIKPFFGQLRRYASPALWCQMRKSYHHTYFHFKIHRLQVDNQLPDAVFPTVIYPGPTPQTVVRRHGPKPCLEVAVLLHKSQDRITKTVKYLKVLMQTMHVKLDKGFILSLHDVFSSFSEPEPEDIKLRTDLIMIQKPLFNPQELGIARNKECLVFEYIHLSPVKIHFSFSPRGTVQKAKPDHWTMQTDAFDFLINSIGATLSEVKDVELKMAYFEKKGISITPQNLLLEVKSHYLSQLVRQTYVMVLGLDILGNPYGLVKDFTRGLGDFFYEPFVGSVSSPDEFADSLARGAQSLFGHVIGGTAGAISLITGSLGQTLSVLTFDEEFKRKRYQRLHQTDLSLPETVLTAMRGFVLGVTLGLSGVFVQPITGAQQEGVEGFFKGIGKGLLGLITKPAGGVVDMVSMAFDGLRRAAELGENVVVRIRLPRYINPILGLRPYSPYQASGNRLLYELSKGHYINSDVYWAHAALGKSDKADVALITDKHMFLLEKCRFWGDWDIEWVVSIDDVMTVPYVTDKNLVIKIKQEDSLLNFAGDERFVHCEEEKVLEWLKECIEKALLFNMREKPCPADV